MPLTAPRVPQYQSRQNLPATLPNRYADLRPAYAIGQAIERAGSLLSQRADELQRQRNAAVVGDIYNEWRDQDREALTGLLSKKGQDAYQLGKQYDEWFNKSFEKSNERSENREQQTILKGLLDRKREQSLDILARYEAQEGQRYKAEVEAGVVAQTKKDIRAAGFNNEAVAEGLAELENWLEAAYPGQDLTALKQKYKSQMLFANLQERIDQNPEGAEQALEAWKDNLGEGYFTLKNSIKAKSKENAINRIQAELQSKYEANGIPDFQKMQQDLTHRKDIDLDVKFEVRQWLDAYQIQYENNLKANQKAFTENEESHFGNLLMDGKLSELYNEVRQSPTADKVKWFKLIQDQKNKKDPPDPIDKALEIVRINSMITRGESPEAIRIAIQVTPNFTEGDKEQYLNKLETKLTSAIEKGRSEGYRVIVDMIFPQAGGPTQWALQAAKNPQQTIAIATAMGELDDWIDNQLKVGKYPTRNEIRMKGIEFGQSNITPVVQDILNQFYESQKTNQ